MTLDPSIPAYLIDPTSEGSYGDYEPRASRLLVPALRSIRTEVWMGGVHTALGDPVASTHVRAAWVVDCAGEMPPHLALEAGRLIPRVFTDIEAVPGNLPRIRSLVDELAEALHGAEAPERLYVMCKQGLNRSGLVTALVLTALGTPSTAAVAAIREARPGALNNATFARLVAGEPEPDTGG